MQNLHLSPEGIKAGMTLADAERISLIRIRALIAVNGGPALSKDDMAFALTLFDRLMPFCDFDEERRWQAECIRKQVNQ
jgi:hypothetical protein